MIYHPDVEDQTSLSGVTMTIAAVNYCCIYFLNSKTTWGIFIFSLGDLMGIDDFISTANLINL